MHGILDDKQKKHLQIEFNKRKKQSVITVRETQTFKAF